MLQVDLTGKNAVVTGATRGIGFGIAKALAKSGASVACIGTNEEKLNASVAEIVADGGSAKAYICNVADSEAVAKTAETIIADFNKKVDILVNNAGITRDMLMRRITDEQWNDVISVNLNGTFYVTRAFVEQMRRGKWGRIINISSISGLIGNKGQANYSASKAGVIGFTRTISKELANRNITANAICPGFIDTDMTACFTAEEKAAMAADTPLGRIGTPEDVAELAAFLASDRAGFITGQIIGCDGGFAL